MATACDIAIKNGRHFKETSETHFSHFWHKKSVATIDILYVYNREVRNFSQKFFVIVVMLVEKLSLFKFPE